MIGIRFSQVMALFAMVSVVRCLTLNYCSKQNLGGSKTYSEWMSTGLCHDTCNSDGYAVAILQENYCWCSNYIPDDTVSLSDCSGSCPGISSEHCASDGYYGYIVVTEPSGTEGSSVASSTRSDSSSTSASSSSSSSSDKSSSSAPTTGSSSSPESSSSASSSFSSSASSSSSSSSAKSSKRSSKKTSSTTTSEASDSSFESVRYVTTIYSASTPNASASPMVITKYITKSSDSKQTSSSSSSSSSSPSSASKNKGNSFFDSKGKVAGTFTAVGIVVVGIVAGILYCCCCMGGAAGDNDDFTDEENQYSYNDSFVNNEKAKGGVQITGASSPTSATHLNRNDSGKSLLSFLNGTGAATAVGRSSSKKKLNPNKHNRTASSGSNNINSPIYPISEFDNRLDPHTMFMNNNESKKSLGDDVDYSRKILKITNPE